MKHRLMLGLNLGCGLILFSLLGIQTTYADNLNQQTAQRPVAGQAPTAKGPGGKPPEAAITLCLNKANKSQCSFQGPRGLETGNCEYTPDQQYFACNPNRSNRPANKAANTSQVKQYPSHLAPDNN